MGGLHAGCAGTGVIGGITHVLTDYRYGRTMILDVPAGDDPTPAAEKIMRSWPAPTDAAPSRTYCQYGIIHAVPPDCIRYESLARDGKHSLTQVASGHYEDNEDLYEWEESCPVVVVHPPEPACPRAPKDAPGHLWGADWRVVGGIVEDHPGVFGTCSGPGLRIDEHCTRPGCHATRTRDTHAVDEGHDAKQDSYLCISYGELQNEEERRAHDAVYGTVPGEAVH